MTYYLGRAPEEEGGNPKALLDFLDRLRLPKGPSSSFTHAARFAGLLVGPEGGGGGGAKRNRVAKKVARALLIQAWTWFPSVFALGMPEPPHKVLDGSLFLGASFFLAFSELTVWISG